jgi:galactokinase/mevalonate kinase-like predicted kinase
VGSSKRVYEASAPGRCGIIGNPSDIYGGTVVSCSVPARARCRLEFGGEERLPEDLRLWEAGIRRFPLRDAPVAVHWETDIPRSSGLSGSTALLAATLSCVLASRGEHVSDPIEFSELVRDVERNDAHIVCGFQDAYMIVHGGLRRMDFAGKHPTVPGPAGRIESIDAPLPFLLVTTGVERLSGAVHGPMSLRWLNGEKAVVKGIARITELGRVGAEAMSRQDWAALADLMTENQHIVADLGGSGDEIDQLIAACLRGGALSAKLAGAGLGGTVIALTHEADDLEAALRANGYSRFMRPALAPGVQSGPLR